MGSIDFAMVHNCQILRDAGTTQDTSGSPIPNLIPTDSKCLFSKVSTAGNYISETEAGKVKISSNMVFLPASVVVEKGDLIATTEPNWKGTYEVQDVDTPEVPGTGIIDHIEASLKEVIKRE